MRSEILGCPIDIMSFEKTAQTIIELASARRGGYQVSLNTLKIFEFYRNSIVSQVIRSADICSADGVSVVFACRILNNTNIDRIAGIDLAEEIINLCDEKQLSIYLLGASQATLSKLIPKLGESHPNLKIAGYRNGYWLKSEEEGVIRNVAKSGAHVCFIALPSPQKEVLLLEYKDHLAHVFLLPVGGSFDVFVGFKRRAPEIVQKIGMEWFYRFLQEPKRLFKRYLKANSFFLIKLISEFWKKRITQSLKSK